MFGSPSQVANVLAHVVALMLLAFPVLAGETASQTNSVGLLESEESFKDYTLRICRDDDTGDGSFEILHEGKQVHLQHGHKFQLPSSDDPDAKEPLLRVGQDITGEGVPNLVVMEWTGGAHCCYNFNVFEIGEHFRKIATLEAGDTEGATFVDLDGDGRLEFKMQDWTFAYWNACFAASPAPALVLRYQQGEYRLAGDLMRRSAPTTTELAAMVQTIRTAFTNDIYDAEGGKGWKAPSELWGEMLDLIYSGNMESALQLVNLAWPPEQPGMEKFVADFLEQLSKSRYFTQVLALNAESQDMSAANEISASLTSTTQRPEDAGSPSVVVRNVHATVVDHPFASDVVPVGSEQARLSLHLGPTPELFLFGVPGRSYRIEYTDDLYSEDSWQFYQRVLVTSNPVSILWSPVVGMPHGFFRAVAE
jgi:hypothetical protein